MATIGSASAAPDFPLERIVEALVRLAGVLMAFWGAFTAATALVIGLPILLMLAADADDTAVSIVYAASAPLVSGLGNGVVVIVGGFVLAAAAKRVARFVTKDL